MTRGALAAGPLLLSGVLSGLVGFGVLAAIAAMLAGTNDRPGSRRASVKRLGVPALAGALGLLAGAYGGQQLSAVPLTLLLTALGLAAGCVSAVGPVASAAGTPVAGSLATARRAGALPAEGAGHVTFGDASAAECAVRVAR